jgi:hypothetical protein
MDFHEKYIPQGRLKPVRKRLQRHIPIAVAVMQIVRPDAPAEP